MNIQIKAQISDRFQNDLLDYRPVQGTWEVSSSKFRDLVPAVAAAEAALVARTLSADDIHVELFRDDGSPIDGGLLVTSGVLLARRNR